MMQLLQNMPDENSATNLRPLSGAVALAAAATFIILQLAFVGYLFPAKVFVPLKNATAGLVQPTLIANLAILVSVVGIILVFLGTQRRTDLGWSGSLRLAILGTFAVWLAINVIEAIMALTVGATFWNSVWIAEPCKPIGRWLAETFGTALVEETLFRGVALRQIAARLNGPRWPALQRWGMAIALSQLLFAIMHIPLLLFTGAPVLSALPGLFVAGTVLAVLYLVTRNLFLCVGVHGLADAPTLVVVDRLDLLDSQYFAVLSCLMLIAIGLWQRREPEPQRQRHG